MTRLWPLLVLLILPAGCGLVDTGATTAAGAQSAAQQAAEAKQTEDRVRQQLDAAARQAADQRRTAEDAAR
jgi:hypothetical protein